MLALCDGGSSGRKLCGLQVSLHHMRRHFFEGFFLCLGPSEPSAVFRLIETPCLCHTVVVTLLLFSAAGMIHFGVHMLALLVFFVEGLIVMSL